jgi:type III secretory pathway component EscS
VSKGFKSLLLIVMDILWVVAVALVVRIVVAFFGTLAASDLGAKYLELSRYLVIPFGVDAIATPYAGSFDVDATITVGLLLLVEWGLSALRRRA